ncbi:uncharacterized protein PGTG_04419 [Puccinia graminis f. sp. tritici CRL 75-36-700-3]|uniref:Uncharacterized protein n=1 Tax=Puccinia graminis f. sp. tritici (strain CRL 75-36-700-3 / race SCCL) TaxID=418459 RepID=E3K294_PUCGT|nr:uncharacterized protein PGTG_04419 [Puccinia graminis f. sp. tritici CRL 75-36-700-3]EFP78463.1 hypothetical protein PGTG_04419 [Puccinia graminis f. sp. tritici CRL 75-36-700-3]
MHKRLLTDDEVEELMVYGSRRGVDVVCDYVGRSLEWEPEIEEDGEQLMDKPLYTIKANIYRPQSMETVRSPWPAGIPLGHWVCTVSMPERHSPGHEEWYVGGWDLSWPRRQYRLHGREESISVMETCSDPMPGSQPPSRKKHHGIEVQLQLLNLPGFWSRPVPKLGPGDRPRT